MFDDAEMFHPPLSAECFSTRQWEIIRHLVQGETVKDIAAALYLSPSTVRNHLTAIYKKFGVHSQAGLLAKFLEKRG
jgi:DNA-binding NarL/FixJ family response regulator